MDRPRSQPATPPAQATDTAALRLGLEEALHRHFGAPRRITSLERRGSAYRTSFALEELDVRLEDGASLRLMFKDLGWHTLPEHVRQAKPAFVYDPLREIRTYQAVLAGSGLGTPTGYGAVVDHQLERYWLFLEKVPGVELYQVGEFETWQRVGRWLAGMHTQFSRQADLWGLAEEAHLLRYDADFYRLWMRRAQTFSHRAESRLPDNARRGLARVAERYDRVVEQLLALPLTFIHGEFYASNVLVQPLAGGVRVCPIDWEMAAVGPGPIDLAALIAGGWTEEEKEALALAYYAALTPMAGWPRSTEAFLAALDCCRLHLAVQWLGWSPDWSPPPEHAQDWLREALCLAEKLGL